VGEPSSVEKTIAKFYARYGDSWPADDLYMEDPDERKETSDMDSSAVEALHG